MHKTWLMENMSRMLGAFAERKCGKSPGPMEFMTGNPGQQTRSKTMSFLCLSRGFKIEVDKWSTNLVKV